MDTTQTTHSIIIREAKREECPLIWSMIFEMMEKWQSAPKGNAKAFETMIFDEHAAYVLLALYDDIPAGFCFYTKGVSPAFCMHSITIQNLYVQDSYRRKGIGTAIWNYLKQKVQEEGLLGLKLFVDALNSEDNAFYTAMGMKPKDVRLSYRWNTK